MSWQIALIFFSSIGSELQKQIHFHGNDFSKYLVNPNGDNFFIIPSDEIEIISLIDNLCSTKATGSHSVPSDILQLLKFNISAPLTE